MLYVLVIKHPPDLWRVPWTTVCYSSKSGLFLTLRSDLEPSGRPGKGRVVVVVSDVK